MSSQILKIPVITALDSNGAIAAGAKLYTYAAGTTTPQSVYTDYALTTAAANPVVANDQGVFAPLYLSGEAYKFVLKTSDDAETLWTADNYTDDISTTLLTVAALKAYAGPATLVTVAGHTAAGDGGGGPIVWNGASTATADDFLVFARDGHAGAGRYERVIENGRVYPEMGGVFSTDADAGPRLREIAPIADTAGYILDFRDTILTITTGVERDYVYGQGGDETNIVPASDPAEIDTVAVALDIPVTLSMHNPAIDISGMQKYADGFQRVDALPSTQIYVTADTSGPSSRTITIATASAASRTVGERVVIRQFQNGHVKNGRGGIRREEQILSAVDAGTGVLTVKGFIRDAYTADDAVIEPISNTVPGRITGRVYVKGGGAGKSHTAWAEGWLYKPYIESFECEDCELGGLMSTHNYKPTVGPVSGKNVNLDGYGYLAAFLGCETPACGTVTSENCRHSYSSGRATTGQATRHASRPMIITKDDIDSPDDKHDGSLYSASGPVSAAMSVGNGGDAGVTLEDASGYLSSVQVTGCGGSILQLDSYGGSDPGGVVAGYVGQVGGTQSSYSSPIMTVQNIDDENGDPLYFGVGQIAGVGERLLVASAINGDVHLTYNQAVFKQASASGGHGISVTGYNSNVGTVTIHDCKLDMLTTSGSVHAVYAKDGVDVYIASGKISFPSGASGIYALRADNARIIIGAGVEIDIHASATEALTENGGTIIRESSASV